MSNLITFGSDADNPLFAFSDGSLRSVTSSTNVDIVGAELYIDTLTANAEYNVEFADESAIVFTPLDYDGVITTDDCLFCANASESGDFRVLPPGTIVRQYHDDVLIGKFYLKNIERIGRTLFRVNAVSAIGLLDMQDHLGGLYTGTKNFGQVVDEIIGNVIPYSIEADVSAIPVYGWLPKDTARNNLHKLLFAEGVSITKDSDGDIVFSFLYASSTPPSVPSSRIYLGGNIDYSTPATAVEITEHTFYDSGADETVTLFDNSTALDDADNLLVVFSDAPIHGLVAIGLTVSSSGANYAVVSGRGTLTGQKYTHTTTIVRKTANGNGADNVVSVTDDCLIVLQNSENVAKRVLAYYSSKKKVGAGILLDGEKAGRQIAFTDPYGDPATGYISFMEITASTTLKADARIITDYTPTGQGNNYSQYFLLTEDGTFTVPDGITELKVVCAGGGHGGYQGEAGHTGTGGELWPSGDGAGGAGGQGGEGGKVYQEVLAVNPGDTISYTIGSGGAAGQAGGDTVFGNISSASGSVPASGFINIFTGAIYGVRGSAGESGINGASMILQNPTVMYNGVEYKAGEQGQTASGGGYYLYGGYGGAPAKAVNGGNGSAGALVYDRGVLQYAVGGNGGTGATPTIRGEDAAVYACGGQGGIGGSGGGQGGTCYYPVVPNYQGAGGAGGQGGLGGRGANGCVIIYC